MYNGFILLKHKQRLIMALTKEEKLEKKRLEKEKQEKERQEFLAKLPVTMFNYMASVTKMHDHEGLNTGFDMEYQGETLFVTFRFYYNDRTYTETINMTEAEEWEVNVIEDGMERTRNYAEQLRREAEEKRIREEKRKQVLAKLTQEERDLLGVK